MGVVHPDDGAGIELTPTCWGMRVDTIEPKPGQPHLSEGATITKIGDANLLGLPDPDAVFDAFGGAIGNGVPIEVEPVTYETISLPSEASKWPASFTSDLSMLADKFSIEYNISRLGLEIRGPQVGMEPAKKEMGELLDFYQKGKSAGQQQQAPRQAHIDHSVLQDAARRAAERQRREAEEYAAWHYAMQQMAQQHFQQQLMLQQAAQQMAMQQQAQHQQMFQHAAAQGYMPAQAPMMQQPAYTPWISYYDAQGNLYYYNEQTGESAWSLPPGMTCRDGNPSHTGQRQWAQQQQLPQQTWYGQQQWAPQAWGQQGW